MSLWYAYHSGFTVAVVLGMLSILLGGELPVACWLLAVVPLLIVPLRLEQKCFPGWFATVMGGISLLIGLYTAVERGVDGMVLGAAIAILGMTAARLVSAAHTGHDMQVLLLSLLSVFAGSVLHTQLTYGFVMVGYGISSVWALSMRQLMLGAQRMHCGQETEELSPPLQRRTTVSLRFLTATSLLAVAILASTTLLFFIFPRVGISGLGLVSRQRTALPPAVSLLGEPRTITAPDSVVARIYGLSVSHFKTGIYLRGPVYEELLPHGFERSKRGYDEPDSLVQMRPRGDSVAYEVFTQPLGGLELLSLGRVRHARIVSGGDSNPSVPLRMRGLAATGTLTASRRVVGPLRYVVEGTIETPSRVPVLGGVGGEPDDVTDVNLVSLTELPEHVDARIIALAADLTQEAGTFREKARTIRKHLADGFEYSLEQPNADKPDPLASFLFDDRRGHCEYFATAFATLLRAAGVPSRVIGGYQGGIWDEDTNVLLFSGKSAHSWVEWYQPGTGWIIDDATPALYTQRQYLTGLAKMYERVQRMWDEYIVEYGQAHQLAFVARTYAAMSRPGWTTARSIRAYYVFGIVVLALLVFWYRRRNRAQPIRIRRLESLADAMAAVLERTRGREIPEHMPLRVAFEEAVSTQALSAEPLGTLRGALTYYETTRFGNRSIDTETVRFWLARLRRIKRRV